jgi:glutathione reductase (NADPH)
MCHREQPGQPTQQIERKKENLMKKYDVIIVGSGTAGYTVAKACTDADLKVALVEEDVFGGTCALNGCQPKKFFVVQAELIGMAQHLEGKGVVQSPILDWKRTAAFKNEFTDAVPSGSEKSFAGMGVTLYKGSARFVEAGVLEVGDTQLQAESIVLATGARARVLDLPGWEFTRNSNDFLAQPELPASCLFIGGGYIAFEFAHVAAAYGAQVTILDHTNRVLRQFEAELVDAAVEASEAAGISIHTQQVTTGIKRTDGGYLVRCQGGAEYEAEAVYGFAGRVANLEGLNLEALGVSPDSRGLVVDSTMQVEGVPGLYAVGDCARTPALAPVADREALVAATNIAGQSLKMDYSALPSVCFTQPPLASVGLTEEAARNQDLNFEVRRGDMTGWPNQRRIGATHGRYKLLIGEKGQVLGAHILGHEAGDQINLFALAMKGGLKGDAFKEIMWAYPTLTSDTKYMV